MKKAFSKMSEV